MKGPKYIPKPLLMANSSTLAAILERKITGDISGDDSTMICMEGDGRLKPFLPGNPEAIIYLEACLRADTTQGGAASFILLWPSEDLDTALKEFIYYSLNEKLKPYGNTKLSTQLTIRKLALSLCWWLGGPKAYRSDLEDILSGALGVKYE
jgi:hypothetical protein